MNACVKLMQPAMLVGILVVILAGPTSGQEVDFAKDIRPILVDRCSRCHGGVQSAGGVTFVDRDRVTNQPGESGKIVIRPGDPEASELYRRITSEDPNEVMPQPDAYPPLARSQIDLIRRWIQQGAKWPRHWAYEPPKLHAPSVSKFDSLAKNEIDRYLFARMQQEQLEPAPVAAPGRLLRRLSIGLTGLPPTLDQLSAFESAFGSDSDAAVESAVDRLLDSPAFGERWASMWLDLVRYADSAGLGQDQRRTIWLYRDWVVRAFNDDMPFDQFTIKQLAGDLLPQPSLDDLVATACHRNTQTNNEDGTDDEAFRVEAVIDRVNTTWQAWGSTTFGCAQCHDHPSDPFGHKEYYQFLDFFNGTADSDTKKDDPRIRVPTDRRKFDRRQELNRRWQNLRQKIYSAGTQLRDDSSWRTIEQLQVSSQNDVQYVVDKTGVHTQFHTVGLVSANTQTLIDIGSSDLLAQPVTALQLTVFPLDPATSLHSPEWGFWVSDLELFTVGPRSKKTKIKLRWSVPDVAWLPADPFLPIAANGKNWSANTRIHHPRRIVLVPEQPIQLADDQQLRLEITCDQVATGAQPLIIKRGQVSATTDQRWNRFGMPESPVASWHTTAESTRQAIQAMRGTHTPIMLERPSHLRRPTHIFIRGNSANKGQQVFAALPKSMTSVTSLPPVTDSQSSSRLDMARWWVAPKNPLTARVLVNRLWAQLFGTGIVASMEDFGISGDRPSHPALLDYLAIRFQRDHRWSVKAIVREIVLSHAYRQSAITSPAQNQRDPSNRLLARGPRLPLPAEAVRDHMLAVSGLLSTEVGGAPVRPPIPKSIWNPFDRGDRWETAPRGTADRYRRSIYVYVKRSIPYPALAVFDAPSREFCSPKRLRSNSPLQALATLNDPVFVECAEDLGRRIREDFQGSLVDRLDQAYRSVTGRLPSQVKREQLLRLLDDVQKEHGSLQEEKPASQSASGKEDRKDQKDHERLAWTVVGQVLLNLDEGLTY